MLDTAWMELTNEAYYPESPRATPALAGDSQLGGVGEVRTPPEREKKHRILELQAWSPPGNTGHRD